MQQLDKGQVRQFEKAQKTDQIFRLGGDAPNDEMDMEILDTSQSESRLMNHLVQNNNQQQEQQPQQNRNIQIVEPTLQQSPQKVEQPRISSNQYQQPQFLKEQSKGKQQLLDYIKQIDSRDRLLNVAEVLDIPAIKKHMSNQQQQQQKIQLVE